MTMVFHHGDEYRSAVWPEITIRRLPDHILIRSTERLRCLSSALWGGGFMEADYLVNGDVPLDFRADDPSKWLGEKIGEWGYPPERTVGLITAASLKNASILEEAGDQHRLIVCVTAGTNNAARAGRVKETFSAYRAGTINCILLIDGRLTPSAMVNAVMTATEAKAAVLQDLEIQDGAGRIATGTTTDSIVVAASQNGRYNAVHAYAGTATTIGDGIARLVYQAVREAILAGKGEGF